MVKSHLLFGLMLGSAVTFSSFNANNLVIKNSENESTLKDKYHIGETIKISPKKIVKNNKTYDTYVIITTPSKNSYITNEIYIDELGEYKVEYRAKNEASIINEIVTFTSYDDLFMLTGNKSSVSYKEESFGYNTKIKGLNLRLHKDEEFIFNEPIDLNELKNTNNFIELFLAPNKGFGNRDLGKLKIKLTDAHDPKNFVNIIAQSVDNDGSGNPWWSNNTYIQAGANNQALTGIEWGNPTMVHSGNNFGHPYAYSMYGYKDFKNSVGEEIFGLKFDLDENRLYTSGAATQKFIIDFDDKTYFSNLWNGFTTGEVYLSISGDKYFEDSANILIKKIGNSDLTKELLTDTKKPTIKIENKDFDLNNMPHGLINKKYPIFKASANDSCNPNLNVTTKVFFNYTSNNRYELNINNGYIIPTQEGTYTVEYSAKDYSNNISIVTYSFEVKNEKALFLDVDNTDTESKVGEIINIKKANYGGGIGKLNLKTYYEFNNQLIEIKDNKFRPLEIGKYKIIYEIKDMSEETLKVSYIHNVKENKAPIFLDEPNLPQMFISNNNYELKTLKAYDFYNKKEVESKIKIITASRNFDYDGSLNFNKEDGDKAIIKFEATSNNLTSTLEKEIKINHISNTFDFNNYFIKNNINLKRNDNAILVNTAENKVGEFEYVLPLNSSIFRSTFKLNLIKEGYYEMFLKDYDTSLNLKIKFIYNAQNKLISIYVNDELTSINYGNNSEISLEVNFKTNTINFNNRNVVVNGLNKFSKEGVFFKGRLSSINNSLELNSINNQKMYVTKDIIAPELILPNYTYLNKVNSVLNLEKACIFDVFSYKNSVKLTMKNPSGNIVKSVNNEVLDNIDATKNYQINLNMFGVYVIEYTYRDMFGNQNISSFKIKTIDSLAPTITLINENKTEATLNEIIDIAEANASDDVDGEVDVYTFIITPDNVINALSKVEVEFGSGKVLLNKLGKWTIRYVATDNFGNVKTLDNFVWVK